MSTAALERIPVRSAAAHFGVTERTIYNWIASGVIDAVRVGPKLLYVDLDSVRTAPVGGAA